MEIKISGKTIRNISLCVVGFIALYWILSQSDSFRAIIDRMMSILSPFIVGAVIAFVVNVPMRFIEGLFKRIKRPKLRRFLALFITLVLLCLVVAGVVMLLVPQLIETIQTLIPKLESFFVRIGNQVNQFLAERPEITQWLQENVGIQKLDWPNLVQKYLNVVGNGISALFSQAVSAIGSITSGVMSCFISIVFAVYALIQKETLARQGRKVLYALLPESKADYVVSVLRLSNSTFSNFLSGQCLEVCILAGLFAVAMAIFGMPYISLVCVLIAVTAFIPLIGAWIGCIVGAFLIMVANPIQALWFVVMFLVIQQFEGNVIYPRVVGTSIGLPGMWVLLAISVGGELFGVVGMFLMIPLSSVIYALIRQWINGRLEKRTLDDEKLTPQPPDIYSNRIPIFRKKKKK